jgi:hypothetical protein
MCEIGKPVEIIDVVPVSLPAPLRKQEQPENEPVVVPVEVPVATVENVLVERS